MGSSSAWKPGPAVTLGHAAPCCRGNRQLGRLAVTEAAQRGHDVGALVRDPARANLPEPVVKVRGDVLDPASLDPAPAGREAVICALGTPSPRQASTLLVDGTRNLVAAMKPARGPPLPCAPLLGPAH